MDNFCLCGFFENFLVKVVVFNEFLELFNFKGYSVISAGSAVNLPKVGVLAAIRMLAVTISFLDESYPRLQIPVGRPAFQWSWDYWWVLWKTETYRHSYSHECR